jgi:hypothetical protein
VSIFAVASIFALDLFMKAGHGPKDEPEETKTFGITPKIVPKSIHYTQKSFCCQCMRADYVQADVAKQHPRGCRNSSVPEGNHHIVRLVMRRKWGWILTPNRVVSSRTPKPSTLLLDIPGFNCSNRFQAGRCHRQPGIDSRSLRHLEGQNSCSFERFWGIRFKPCKVQTL